MDKYYSNMNNSVLFKHKILIEHTKSRDARCRCKYWKNWHWNHRQWIQWSTDDTGTPIFIDILDTSVPVNVGVPVSSVLQWTQCQWLPVISKLTPRIPNQEKLFIASEKYWIIIETFEGLVFVFKNDAKT